MSDILVTSPASAAFVTPSDFIVLVPAASIAVTDDQLLAAVRALLLALCSVPVVRGQDNRVPEPRENTYIVITGGSRLRLGTNVTVYVDPVALGITPAGSGLKLTYQPMQVTVQVDAHGPGSADIATVVTTMLRDEFACDFMEQLNVPIQPLFTSDPRQLPFTNEGGQTEDRWSIDAVFQCNVMVSTAQDFAQNLAVNGFYQL